MVGLADPVHGSSDVDGETLELLTKAESSLIVSLCSLRLQERGDKND
jgi:hypothetical protein